MKKYKFRLPDNWHAHLRQNKLLEVIYHHFNIYGRVLCMGNTSPLIETAIDALNYRKEILSQKIKFNPLTCIMLTEDTTPEMIREASKQGIKFVKFIPVGTSTGATKGLRLFDIVKLSEIFSVIEELGMHLLIHAELIIDYFDVEVPLIKREAMAIALVTLCHELFPKLKITIEHVSTAGMINFVKSKDSRFMRASIAPQHALLCYPDVFNENNRLINPYNYCLPVLKNEQDRQAVEDAMVSGDEHFFAGTDAAPHWDFMKQSKNPPAGIFFGSSEYLRYLEKFERRSAVDKFEDFTSRFGAEYYGYQLNNGVIIVKKENSYQPIGENGVNFCLGGTKLSWTIEEVIH